MYIHTYGINLWPIELMEEVMLEPLSMTFHMLMLFPVVFRIIGLNPMRLFRVEIGLVYTCAMWPKIMWFIIRPRDERSKMYSQLLKEKLGFVEGQHSASALSLHLLRKLELL